MARSIELLLVSSFVLLVVISASGNCDAPGLGKLESSSVCEDFCGVDTPCVVLDVSSGLCDGSRVNSSLCTEVDDPVDGDGSCAYVCAFHTTQSMIVFVDFGSYVSEEEASASNSGEDTRSSGLADVLDDSDGHFTISGDVLNAIGNLSVGAYATSVYVFHCLDISHSVSTIRHACRDIIGGTILYYSTRGTVVNVSIQDNFLHEQVNITEVSLSNINLKGQMSTLTSLLPPTVASLTLANTLHYEFPWVLADYLTGLQEMCVTLRGFIIYRFFLQHVHARWLSYNYITNVSGPTDGDAGFDALISL